MLPGSIVSLIRCIFSNFFFNYTPTTVIYALSLHDALPIFEQLPPPYEVLRDRVKDCDGLVSLLTDRIDGPLLDAARSEEHTSELQSLRHLVCRLLLEKKKNVR